MQKHKESIHEDISRLGLLMAMIGTRCLTGINWPGVRVSSLLLV